MSMLYDAVSNPSNAKDNDIIEFVNEVYKIHEIDNYDVIICKNPTECTNIDNEYNLTKSIKKNILLYLKENNMHLAPIYSNYYHSSPISFGRINLYHDPIGLDYEFHTRTPFDDLFFSIHRIIRNVYTNVSANINGITDDYTMNDIVMGDLNPIVQYKLRYLNINTSITGYVDMLLKIRTHCASISKDRCIISRPYTRCTLNGEILHDMNNYAIEWDGYGQYYVNGIYFTDREFKKIKSRTFDIEMIVKEPNIEKRASMILLFGPDKFLEGYTIEPIDYLYKTSMVTGNETTCKLFGIANMLFLSLEDHSNHKRTILPVPPNINSVKHALAWSFNMESNSYECKYES